MNTSTTPGYIKRQVEDERVGKNEIKPVMKTLNRVPRACNACRKQKMRCEGADNPPCKRCRNGNLECLFEKPSREATLTGEAGLERIRSLEAHVAEIRNTQNTISNTLSELLAHFRSGSFKSPISAYPQSFNQQSPSLSSPSVHALTPTSGQQDIQNEVSRGYPGPQQINQGGGKPRQSSSGYQASSLSSQNATADTRSPSLLSSSTQETSTFSHPLISQVPTLPPFSTISTMGQPLRQASDQCCYQDLESAQCRSTSKNQSGKRRSFLSLNGGSDNSSDSDAGDLPDSGLVAPWEVLRGLADVAIERAAQEHCDSSGSHSRERTPPPDRQTRPSKRRKMHHKLHRSLTFPDVVTKNIISEDQARELFNLFYHGCSTFLPVFDSNSDTYDSLHKRSPFAVDCICMVAARTRDGAHPSEIYIKILEEVQAISCATLFAPVMRSEAVQAMILVSGWSDNGWLSGGHAVRMAMELSMHKAWPKLLSRMKAKKIDLVEDRDLVIASRTWFCLYLFEHQLSYGTGRPAVLKEDESIRECRLLLQHPLAIEDDMRLVSTVELMAIRERVNNAMIPMEGPVKEEHFLRLQTADEEFTLWYDEWDEAFSQKYEDAAFYRQSLQIQHLHAELFHNANALRGINGPDDVHNMPQVQRDVALRSIEIAVRGLDITVNSPSYREGMKYAVHYTHATATFAASFLLRLARLFPDNCDLRAIRSQVERLVNLLSEIPGKRYALTLQLMLKRLKKRRAGSYPRSPQLVGDPQRLTSLADPLPQPGSLPQGQVESFSSHCSYTTASGLPNINTGPNVVHHQRYPQPTQHLSQYQHLLQQQHNHHYATDAEHIWRGFETTANEQVPIWMSDQSLGGNSFTQNGMDAFLLPNDYMPAPQIR